MKNVQGTLCVSHCLEYASDHRAYVDVGDDGNEKVTGNVHAGGVGALVLALACGHSSTMLQNNWSHSDEGSP